MFKYFDWYNSVLQVLIVNYKNQRQQLSVAILGQKRQQY